MTNREELINEDWGKEYSKLADLYAKKCKEVRELKDKNKQIRAEVIEEVIEYLREELNKMSACKQRDGYRMAILDLVGLKEQK